MRIETYSDRYFGDVVKLVENFHKEAVAEYEDTFKPESVIEIIKTADRMNAFLLIINETCQGILYGMTSKSFTSDKIIFQELIWYVNEPFRSYGVRLLRDVEKVLKVRGISIIIMAVLENSKTEKLKKFYERLGYKRMETHYIRSL